MVQISGRSICMLPTAHHIPKEVVLPGSNDTDLSPANSLHASKPYKNRIFSASPGHKIAEILCVKIHFQPKLFFSSLFRKRQLR